MVRKADLKLSQITNFRLFQSEMFSTLPKMLSQTSRHINFDV